MIHALAITRRTELMTWMTLSILLIEPFGTLMHRKLSDHCLEVLPNGFGRQTNNMRLLFFVLELLTHAAGVSDLELVNDSLEKEIVSVVGVTLCFG